MTGTVWSNSTATVTPSWTWLTSRMIDKLRDQFREEIRESKERFEEVAQMYKDNVVLVKNYEKLSTDQQDLIISTTTNMQRLCDKLGQGQ